MSEYGLGDIHARSLLTEGNPFAMMLSDYQC